MLLFFHDIGLTWWLVLIILAVVLSISAFLIRGIWIIIAGKSRRASLYAGAIFGSAIVLWLAAWFTGSMIVETLLMLLTYPFGVFLGFLHANFGFYLIRDAILGDLNSAHHPVEPHIYLYQALINALAVANVTELIEKRIRKRKLR
jgi:hypothetical protein